MGGLGTGGQGRIGTQGGGECPSRSGAVVAGLSRGLSRGDWDAV